MGTRRPRRTKPPVCAGGGCTTPIEFRARLFGRKKRRRRAAPPDRAFPFYKRAHRPSGNPTAPDPSPIFPDHAAEALAEARFEGRFTSSPSRYARFNMAEHLTSSVAGLSSAMGMSGSSKPEGACGPRKESLDGGSALAKTNGREDHNHPPSRFRSPALSGATSVITDRPWCRGRVRSVWASVSEMRSRTR